MILPAPRLRPIPGLVAGSEFSITAPFDTLSLRLRPEATNLTIQ